MIGGAANYVRLSRLGARQECGTAVRIDVKAGPFEGTVRDDTLVEITAFREELSRLYERLDGTATLASYDKFRMVMRGDGRGGIAISVELFGEHCPLSKLSAEFEIDQTYLPSIIEQMTREFPEG